MKIAQPVRASHTYVQRLLAPPQKVFPLLCPVREADWIDGWSPLAVWSASGVAERDCVFLTAAEGANAVWYVTCHEPDEGYVEMLKITPEVTACRLAIQLRPSPAGCEAEVTYTHTSLGAKGDAFVASFTPEHYGRFMQDWEARLNYYLTHGSVLKA